MFLTKKKTRGRGRRSRRPLSLSLRERWIAKQDGEGISRDRQSRLRTLIQYPWFRYATGRSVIFPDEAEMRHKTGRSTTLSVTATPCHLSRCCSVTERLLRY